MRCAAGLDAIETASGVPFGPDPDLRPFARVRMPLRSALEAALVDAVRASPCVVWLADDDASFLVLAAAVAVARREGLPLPIAVTPRHAGVPDDPHHEAVLAALEVSDWERPDVGGRLGLLGAEVQSSLLRHGVRFPGVAHLLGPLLEQARGGVLVSAHEFEELFGLWRGAGAAALVHRRRLPRRGDASALVALAPLPVRRRLAARAAAGFAVPYLRPPAQAQALERALGEWLTYPATAGAAALAAARKRCGTVASETYDLLAADRGARLVVPTRDRTVAGAVASAAGVLGWSGLPAMARAAAPELPPRTTPRMRLDFRRIWDDDEVRTFARDWDGTGLDDEVVDAEVLRSAWLRGDWRSAMLLHSAWLAQRAPIAAPAA